MISLIYLNNFISVNWYSVEFTIVICYDINVSAYVRSKERTFVYILFYGSCIFFSIVLHVGKLRTYTVMITAEEFAFLFVVKIFLKVNDMWTCRAVLETLLMCDKTNNWASQKLRVLCYENALSFDEVVNLHRLRFWKPVAHVPNYYLLLNILTNK